MLAVIGLDIARSVFQLHSVDPQTGEITRLKLKSSEMIPFFANREASTVAMEACGNSHLSPAARRYRFLETMRSPSEALLKLMTDTNASTDAAYVAVFGDGDAEVEIGVGRFSALPDGRNCEFAVTVADESQNKGLGTFLMERLIAAARARGLETMFSSDASDNTRMRQFAEHLHFRHQPDPDDSRLVRYSVDLREPGPMTTP